MYGCYSLTAGERIRFSRKEHKKIISKVVKVIKEYPYFILAEATGVTNNYPITINKSWIYCKEASIERIQGGNL